MRRLVVGYGALHASLPSAMAPRRTPFERADTGGQLFRLADALLD